MSVMPAGPVRLRRSGNEIAVLPAEPAVARADLHPAIAANPFITFFTVATESGTIELAWTDDHNETQTQKADIVVE